MIEFFKRITSIADSKGHRSYYHPRKPYMKIDSEKDSNLKFGLVYSKMENNFRLELSSRKAILSKELLDIYNKNKKDIEIKLNHSLEAREGSKNSDWLRVFYTIPIEKDRAIQSYGNEVGEKFIELVEILKKYI